MAPIGYQGLFVGDGRRSLLSVDLGIGRTIAAGLLLPAASRSTDITDGTSNTLMLGDSTAAGSIDLRDLAVWRDRLPPRLGGGFGLLLPASEGFRFRHGLLLPAVLLLPYVEAQAGAPRRSVTGLRADRAMVQDTSLATGGVAVWLKPQAIIAVLIGL